MKVIDFLDYKLGLMLADMPDASSLKEAGWKTAGTVIGWIMIAGAVIGLVASILFFISWSMAGFPSGSKKQKFLGAICAFVFCTVIGATALSLIGVQSNV